MLTQRQLFLNHIAQTSETPLMLEIERAQDCWLFDVEGKKYLDLIAGISVSNLGHNNGAVKNAIISQLDKYMHLMVYGEFIESPQIMLAKYLANHLPKNLSSVYFTNSGTEAVEGALKLAKHFTGRTEIISFKNSYHGSTHGALSTGGNEERKNAYRPLLPDIKNLDYNNFEQINLISTKTSCVLMEAVQAEAGIILPAENYLHSIRKRCDETNTLLIFDEAQTGCGRTGKLFAFEKFNVIPDILILAKALGGGMPLGAFISSKNILSSFINNPALGHLTTFGGHPVCCAAALAALQETQNLQLIHSVESKSNLFRKLLTHPRITDVRNCGLLIAVEFKNAEITISLIHTLLKKGIVADWFLFAPNCMRIAPPLIISENEIKFACENIIQTLNELN